MKKMIINILRKFVSKTFGINGLNLFKKKYQKKLKQKIYTKKYTVDDIIDVMCKMGMTKGSSVFIHSSMTEFYNFKGNPSDIITRIIEVIGDDGTLMMPAYPPSKKNQINSGDVNHIAFDVKETKSGAGYLTEVFRKYPGVKRSINLQHSICAYGKMADEFTKEHHLSITAWDEKSPYYKMSQINTLVFAFGLPYFLGTMIHCTESLLKDKYLYFNNFFTKEYTYKYKDELGNVGIHTQLTNEFDRVRDKKKMIVNYFDKKEYLYTTISNLRIEMVRADYMLNRFLELADNGITMFSKPNPELYKKDGKFIKI